MVRQLSNCCIITLLTVVSFVGSARADEPAASGIDGAFAEAVATAQKRTVKIYGGAIGRSPGYGTGLVVSASGDILTANGVYLAGQNLRVTLADGTTHEATVTRRSQELQTALLKIDAATPEFYDLPAAPPAEQGDWILAVSNAFKVADGAEPLSVNIGVLSLRMKLDARRGFQDFPYAADVLLFDAITSNPGAAGGAVVTADGKLVGMIGRVIEAKSTNTRLNYAVPVDLLGKFVRGEETAPAAASASNNKADLGIRLFALGGRKAPAFIDSVVTGGPAASAGLKTDDLVVTVGGQVVRDASDFRRLVAALPVGEEVVVEVKRKNELLSVRLVPVPEKQE
ncbi:MAG: S1C family serine protease [Planctomycetaceae bacterium]|nr:S1C family serine protease [Planctomycetaceae bacterium]